MHILFSPWHSIQQNLFPHLEKELDTLSEKEKEFIRVRDDAVALESVEPSARNSSGNVRSKTGFIP